MTVEEAPLPRLAGWRPERPSIVAVAAMVIATLLVAAGLATVVLREAPVYQSAATLLIDQPSLVTRSTNEGVVVKLNQLRAKYGVLANTVPITEPVAQRLGLTPGQVASATVVSLPGPSLVIVIAARTSNPERSRDIADGVAEQLKAYLAAEQEAAGIPVGDRIVFTTVATARPGAKIEPTRGRAVAVGAVGGLVALVGVFVLYQLLPRFRRRD